MSKKGSASRIEITGFNELFGMNDSMIEAGNVQEIMLDELFEFRDHPFRVRDDAKMQELTESIKEYGVLIPGIARIRAGGGYEIIAGHSRKEACRKAGLSSMPMFIRNMSDEEAIIVMVDSNIQREDILPSEKAKAYKMKYDAIKRQGAKGNSLKEMSKESGESAKQIQRYIWLGRLIDELLQMVDEKMLPFGQAVELSFLKKKEQEWVLKACEKYAEKITAGQASELKEKSQAGELVEAKVWEILAPENHNRNRRNITFQSKKIDEYFPEDYSEDAIRNVIFGLLDKWKAGQISEN
ncbi:MAG: ParB/RepB/Spo0J family partition protein [Lachnospiraceae bacterium]|nr:ParB/RepB/Spo0J family partition protein [Lachnospiraceae bacterium]